MKVLSEPVFFVEMMENIGKISYFGKTRGR